MHDYFTKIALESSCRAFNLMDRNSFSKTFGCFDKSYWHFKTKDFPSSAHQMGVEFLARLWSLSHKENIYYKNPQLLEWIKAGISYTCSVQHKDGSFDEWYPNERGWAGPSSYVIHALINAYKIVEDELSQELKQKSQGCFFKTAQFLLKQKEGAVLTNHFALFLLSLYEIYQINYDNKLKDKFEIQLKKLNNFISDEGWSLEYDGVDFGYNLATLSFLGRLDKLYPSPFLKIYAKKHFSFLSYFFYPDGSFGGGLGSRETRHLYPYAFKYWGQYISAANEICNHLLNAEAFTRITPSDQDDHYLFYRLNDYLEADLIDNSSRKAEKENSLPWNVGKDFQKYFKSAGLFIKKSKDFYFLSNLKKGGCFEIYNIKEKKCILKNNGWVIKLKNKSAITSFSISKNHKITIEDNKIIVSGISSEFKQKYFRVITFIIFRLFLLMIRNYKQAFYLKKFVRKILILGKKKTNHRFKRVIIFKEQSILVEDSIYYQNPEKIFYGGHWTMRYVPQSNYFDPSDLASQTSVLYPKNKKYIHITQTCHLKTNKIELCVE